MSTVLLILLILLVVGAVPAWPHSRGWGYGPACAEVGLSIEGQMAVGLSLMSVRRMLAAA